MGLLEEPRGREVERRPVPTTWSLGTVEGDGKTYVVLELHFPVGEVTVFMDPPAADSLAENLKQAARGAKTGLRRVSPEEAKKILGNGEQHLK